ncbi:MAG TPA: hypothetical protein DCR93_08880 [Cytophagales bacterium]|nr:hypothetical protein [Cytophagales bacterium]
MIFNACKSPQKKESEPEVVETDGITPVPLPTDVGIPGYKFPEDSATVYNWLNHRDTGRIYDHGWGIWSGLTRPTSQVDQGRNLLTFETWMGIRQVVSLVDAGSADCTQKKSGPVKLNWPTQFAHAGMDFGGDPFKVMETVSYDPTTVCHIVEHGLFHTDSLKLHKKPGAVGTIPAFPNTSVAIKPVYWVGQVMSGEKLIKLPVWNVPSAPKAWGVDDWGTYVYVDVTNGVARQAPPVPAPKDATPEQIEAAKVNLDQFIYLILDQETADHLNSTLPPLGGIPPGGVPSFSQGDVVLLVAMHVSTREIENWTWQTYYWMPDPDKPLFPSNDYIATLRKRANLVGAASHYAMSIAYNMVWPNQPVNGGTNEGVKPVFAFNPYLEGGFDKGTFGIKNALNSGFEYGVQTNCMSCHVFASYNDQNAGPIYSTDQYISTNDPVLFKDFVKTDFLWSIPDHAR